MIFKQFWLVHQERLQMIKIPRMIMKRPKLSMFGFVETSRDLSDSQVTLGHFSWKDGQETVKALSALFIISQMK